ncbi:MAG TPA: glycosyltransferase family 2 protein [Polyangiaceae bacterium]|nr:glycosyltransferase family 2 protein [Polyangiaceae bacterium]
MRGLTGALLSALAALLALPSCIFFVECVAALLPRRKRGEPSTPVARRDDIRVAVLVPAHDEEAVISMTLAGIVPELRASDRLLVVADNCSDRTADLARAGGAEVIVRNDPFQRGKGFALDFGIAHITPHPPDVLVVIDADCRVERGAIRRLAEFAMERGRPAQADNLLAVPRAAPPLTSISALAFLVRNRVRPTGLTRLGLPCQLMGCGMALPWKVVEKAPSSGSNLVEDMMMGIELAWRGFAPVYCTGAHVTSPPPKRTQAMRGQRRRWEYGHISTLIHRAPSLIFRGFAERRQELLAMGLDLLVPPLALLSMMLAASFLLAFAWSMSGGSPAPLVISSLALGMVGVAVISTWLKFGRQVLPGRYLFALPFYLVWKVPLYLSFLISGRRRGWERTERLARSDSSPTQAR